MTVFTYVGNRRSGDTTARLIVRDAAGQDRFVSFGQAVDISAGVQAELEASYYLQAGGTNMAPLVSSSEAQERRTVPVYYDLDSDSLSVPLAEERLGEIESALGVQVADATGVVATDEAALAAAVAAVPAIGGTVHLKAGQNYKINGNLVFVKDYVTIEGHGATITTTQVATDNVQAIWCIGHGWVVRDLNIVFENAIDSVDKPPALGNGDGLRIGRVNEGYKDVATVENVTVYGAFTSGVQVNYTDHTIITGCRVFDTNGNGIGVSQCREKATIIGNQVDNTGDDGIIIATTMAEVPGGTRSVIIEGNIAENCDAKGIGTTGVDYCVIKGNHVRNTWTFGIGCFQDTAYNLAPSARCIIEGNTIEMAGYSFGPTRRNPAISSVPYGIHIGNVPQPKVRNNIVIDSLGRAINVSSPASDVDVGGNTIVGAAGPGIIVGNPDAADFTNVISGVAIRDNLVRLTQGGIVLGCSERADIDGNIVSSYKNGGSGSRRGIAVGRVRVAQIHGNTVVNDDGGNETIFTYNGCLNVRRWGNIETSDLAAAEQGVAAFVIGSNRISFGSAAPTTGTHAQGDIVFDTTAGNTVPGGTGWICRAAGTPGTWRRFGSGNGTVTFAKSIVHDFASIADGAVGLSGALAVADVVVGDSVAVGATPALAEGVLVFATVTAANVVRLTVFNKTGAPLDLASTTWNLAVTRTNA